MSTVESVSALTKYLTAWSINYRFDHSADARTDKYEEAPAYLRHNPYIRSGYRSHFNVRQCARSVFRWNNETLNIWTHGLFLALFLYHIMDTVSMGNHHEVSLTESQRWLALFQLVCYSFTMGSSVFYHTFCCVSHRAFYRCYLVDILGIVSGSTANYMNGLFYLYECHPGWRMCYMAMTCVIAVLFFVSVRESFANGSPENDYKRFISICCWVSAGALVPVHFLYLSDFKWSEHLGVFVSRLSGFYIFTALAFLVFISRMPERLRPGAMDIVGHSHQWWHVFSAAALYWWYKSALVFADFSNRRLQCSEEL